MSGGFVDVADVERKLVGWDRALEMGAAFDREHPAAFHDRVEAFIRKLGG